MIPITINNNTYNSISAAWREVSPPGLPMITVRWRLKNGWPPVLALTAAAVPPTNRRGFKSLRGV